MVHLNGIDIVGLAAAGLCAGGINAVVGSGTLITFPMLLAVGYPPVVANVSNTVGLVPGAAMGTFGYRRQLRGQGPRIARLAAGAVVGSVTGAALLLVLPASAFKAVVPALIGVGCVLVVAGPRLNRAMARRRSVSPVGHPEPPSRRAATWFGGVTPGLWGGVTLIAVYGGYFGAAQGVLLIGLMGVLLEETLHRINAAKNVLGGLTNFVAALVFVAVGSVAWLPALVVACGSTVGGYTGSRLGQRLHPSVLRAFVFVIGVATIVRLVA